VIAVLTATGLAAAAGLNAYIPFLVIALLARYTDLITMPTSYEWIESWWAIGIGTVLLLVEVVLDKIPVVDSINDTIQTVLRPTMAGLLSAATTSAAALDDSTWITEHPWVNIILGVVVGGLVHAGKATARPVVNAATVGVGAPVVSTVEDVARLDLPDDAPAAYVTQTTLSVDDTRGVIAALQARFSDLEGPDVSDICYATQHRQSAVRDLCSAADLLL